MKKQSSITPLRKAVDWLKDRRIINRDNDLVDIFNLSKSTISIYLSGKPGIEFIEQFEKRFKISLKDFEGEVIEVKKSDEIAVLNAQVKILTKELARLHERVTKQSALDYFLDLEKQMQAELNE